MRINIIKPDTSYYKKGNQYSYDIKSYANEYELLTFHYLKYSYRKFIETYNTKKSLTTRKAFPIQVGINFNFKYLGYNGLYLIDIKKNLPKKKTIGLVKVIGPGEISNNTLHLFTSEEKILHSLNNETFTLFIYYDYWDMV